MEKKTSLDYWERLYSKKNYFGTGPTKLAKICESIIKDNHITNILEIGCGQGRDALHFSHLGYNVYALDISEKAINFVNEMKQSLNYKNITAIIHDIEKPLNHSNEFFDFVYSNLTLQFFDIDSLQKIFNNISTIMKKNSLFLFSTKKEGDKYYNFGTKINNYVFKYEGIIRYFYTEKMLSKILSKNFDILKIESDRHINLDSSISVWWKILVRKK